jgi:putative transposase
VFGEGYDYEAVREALATRGSMRSTFGAVVRNSRPSVRYRATRAGRWMVERPHFWMNRFRRLRIRWEKKVANSLAVLQVACAWITFRAAEFFG